MTYLDSLLAALKSLRVNVMRSVLTALGIIIGVGAVIIMIAVGAGAENRVTKLIQSLGSNMVLVMPGSTTSGGAHGARGSRPTITESDARAMFLLEYSNRVPAKLFNDEIDSRKCSTIPTKHRSFSSIPRKRRVCLLPSASVLQKYSREFW